MNINVQKATFVRLFFFSRNAIIYSIVLYYHSIYKNIVAKIRIIYEIF